MARLEQRIDRLESKNIEPEGVTEIIRRIVRPGDLVCIAEIQKVVGKEPIRIEFPEGEKQNEQH